MNLFLSMEDDLTGLSRELRYSSLAIRSKFNYKKTDILRVGSQAHCSRPADSALYDSLLECFTGGFILPLGSPLWVLGVWVGSLDFAATRWSQVSTHISKIIHQWSAIRASFRNRVLLAKALLLSRCYYLLDSNGAPLPILKSISQKVMQFMRGHFSTAPYSISSTPVVEGGADCPSLWHRHLAYDAKFFANLISVPHDVAWKHWTLADLSQASSHVNHRREPSRVPLNPLLQHTHVTMKLLEPRVRQGQRSLCTLWYGVLCCFPSRHARYDMPSLYHPAIPVSLLRDPALLGDLGITKVLHMVTPGCKLPAPGKTQKRVKTRIHTLMKVLGATRWSYGTHYMSKAQSLHKCIRAWPNMWGVLGCASILGLNLSLLVPRLSISTFRALAHTVPLNTIKKLYKVSLGARRPSARHSAPSPWGCCSPAGQRTPSTTHLYPYGWMAQQCSTGARHAWQAPPGVLTMGCQLTQE